MAADLALGKDQGGPLNMFWGSKQVLKVAYGSTTVWLQPIINISPDFDGGLLSELEAWVDEIPIIGTWLGAGIGLIGDLIAFLIPGNILAILGKVTSYLRSEAVTATDDQFVEVVVATKGYTGLATDVLCHYNEDGSGHQGIGFRLMDSTLAMIQRSGGVTNVVEGCGWYQINDTIRLETWAAAHYHTLLVNGQIRGIFDDLGGLSIGAGFRAVAMAMQAEVATSGGSRSNSPAFKSLIAGDLQTFMDVVASGAESSGGADHPTTVGGVDYDPYDVTANPGGAGAQGGADHTWSYVLTSNSIFAATQESLAPNTVYTFAATTAASYRPLFGDMLGQFDLQVGEGVDPTKYKMIPIDYPGAHLPWDGEGVELLLPGFSLWDGMQQGARTAIATIKGTPGKFTLTGYSQGCAVAWLVYLATLPGGELDDRADDFVGAAMFGSPVRELGHTITGGTDPGGHGCYSSVYRAVDTPPTWWDFAKSADPFTTVGDDTVGQTFMSCADVMITASAIDELGDFVTVLDNALPALVSQIPAVWSELQKILMPFPLDDGTTHGHGDYGKTYTELPGNSTLTAVQLAINHLNSLV